MHNMEWLHNIVGIVSDVMPPHKCIVQFKYKNRVHQALLLCNRLVVNAMWLGNGHIITDYLCLGSTVQFSCHTINITEYDNCMWYVTNAWRVNPNDHIASISKPILGLLNMFGIIVVIAKRQGVLQYIDHEGREQRVLFLGSRVYLYGKRVASKQSLLDLLSNRNNLLFDAVPCCPTENNYQCSWFATAVWLGKKPLLEYDKQDAANYSEITSVYKQIAGSPRSMFFSSKGVVMTILNDDFGVALISLQDNQWETVLFHRLFVFLFKSVVPQDVSLRDIFKAGDRLYIVAASAPNLTLTRWFATQVSIDTAEDTGSDLQE